MVMNGVLTETDNGTQVDFSMDITIVGMLAQFGSRLINDVSDQLLNQFVDNFRNKLAAEAPAEAAEPTPAAEVADAPTVATAEAVAAAPKTTTTAEPEADNSLNAFSLIGTVLRSIFGSIIDFFRSLFGGNKSAS